MLGLAVVGALTTAATPTPTATPAGAPRPVCVNHLETVGIEASMGEVRQRFEEAMESLGIDMEPRRKAHCPEGATLIGINILRVGPMLRVELDLPGVEAPEGVSLSLEGNKKLPDKDALAAALRPAVASYIPDPTMPASGPAKSLTEDEEAEAAGATAQPAVAVVQETAPPPEKSGGGPSGAAVALLCSGGALALAGGGFGVASVVQAQAVWDFRSSHDDSPEIADEIEAMKSQAVVYQYVFGISVGAGAVAAAVGALLWMLSGDEPEAGAGLLTGEQTGIALWWRLP